MPKQAMLVYILIDVPHCSEPNKPISVAGFRMIGWSLCFRMQINLSMQSTMV